MYHELDNYLVWSQLIETVMQQDEQGKRWALPLQACARQKATTVGAIRRYAKATADVPDATVHLEAFLVI